MHYYKRNLGDYAKKAGRLSMLQHGSYTLLIDACYDREQFPTMEEAIEWTWASTTEEIEAVQFVLRKFFMLEDGVYVQTRIREELEEYRLKAETNKRIATERETNRKEKRTNRAPAVNEAPPNQEPITNNQEPVKTKAQREKRADVFDAHSKLIDLGVGDAVANDFMAIRKKKRAPLTETALAEIQRESVKAGITLHQALEKCCARGWQGFEADWVTTTTTNARASPYESEKDRSRREFAESIFGKKNHEPANERDITGVAQRVD